MMPEFSRQIHATISLCLTILALAIVFRFLVQPSYEQYEAVNDSLETLQFQHDKLGNVHEKKVRIERELAEIENTETDDIGFLQENSESLASAEIQNYITSLVGDAHADLISTQVLPRQSETEEVFPSITVKVHLRGDLTALRNILYELSGSEPVLLIDNLNIVNRQQSGRRRKPQSQSKLDVRFDLTGYIFEAADT